MTNLWRTVGVGIGGLAIGALSVVGAVRARPDWFVKEEKPRIEQDALRDFASREKDIFRKFDDQFGGDFFRQNDPFEEMRKFREHLGQDFLAPDQDQFFLKDPFDRWFGKRFGGGTAEDISKREDDNYVYFDIKVDDLNSTSVQTKVENGYINIEGKTSKKSKTDNSESTFESSFHRIFPLPGNVDSSKMETTTEGGKIVLKFPKTKK